jgi:Na+-driven multidrug efflux pump
MALPLIVSFTLRQAFSMVDLVYARFLDDPNALAAIAFYIPFQEIFSAVWVGLSAGFTAQLARAFGRRDAQRVADLKRAMRRILCVLVPLFACGGIAVHAVLPSFDLDRGVLSAFQVYGTTLLIGMPLTGFWSIHPDSVVKAHYDTRSTMLAGIYATATNVALNTLFVFGFGMGLFGIALATVLSRLTALAYAMSRARQHERRRLASEDWPIASGVYGPGAIRAIFLLALPAGATMALASLEGWLVNGLLGSAEHPERALATYGVYHALLRITLMPAIATAVAVVPFVARRIHEDPDPRAVGRELCRAIGLAGGIGLAFAAPVGALFPDQVAGFFVPSDRADALADPTTRAAMRVLPIALLANLPFLILRPTFEALHRPKMGIAISALRFAVLSPPLVLLGHSMMPTEPALGVLVGLVSAAALASCTAAILAARAVLAERSHETSADAHGGAPSPAGPSHPRASARDATPRA